MKVLVACENSGIVRDCFAALGHDAWSCDLLDSDRPGNHVKSDAVEVAYSQYWDIIISHPPCTLLTVANSHNWKRKELEQRNAIRFALLLWSAPCGAACLENPVGILNTAWMPATQIVHPWQFGHATRKRTCLWLKNLPPLVPTKDVSAHMRKLSRSRSDKLWRLSPGPDRWKVRSQTFPGIAAAMAHQFAGPATHRGENALLAS